MRSAVLIFSLLLCACVANEEDVAEQQSALEELPPPPTDDMKPVSQYCGQACAQLQHTRDSMCIDIFWPRSRDGSYDLYNSCIQNSFNALGPCLDACERMYGGGL